MRRLALVALPLALSSAAIAQSFKWEVGHIGRAVVPGTNSALFARTEEAARTLAVMAAYASRLSEPDHADFVKACYMKDVVRVAAGVKVGIVAQIDVAYPQDKDLGAAYLKVKVQSGPLKGSVLYTPWIYMDRYFVTDEPVTVSASSKAAGAFDDYTLGQFYDALNAGDSSLWRGLLALGRVVGLPRGTRGVVCSDSDPDERYVRVRITSGAATGKLVYVLPKFVTATYGSSSPSKKRSRS